MAQAAQTGDLEAFNRLHEHLAASLCVWAQRHVGQRIRTAVDPEDLAQTVWMTAHRALPSFDPGKGSFRYWLFGIAKNTLLELIRSAGRREPAQRQDSGGTTGLQQLQQIPHSVTALVQRVARTDAARLFDEHVKTLSADEQELVVRCGLEGATCRQVAAAMNLSEEAVFKRWQRLRERLRQAPRLRELLDL